MRFKVICIQEATFQNYSELGKSLREVGFAFMWAFVSTLGWGCGWGVTESVRQRANINIFAFCIEIVPYKFDCQFNLGAHLAPTLG